MTDSTIATDQRPAAAGGAPLTVVPLPEDWAVPDDWQRLTTDTKDGKRHGYAGGVAFVLDLDRRVLSARLVSDAERRAGDAWSSVSWLQACAGVVPTQLELGFLSLHSHGEAAERVRVAVLLGELVPLAQKVADRMTTVPGTGARDWTAAAYAAYTRADHLVHRFVYRGTRHDFPYVRPRVVDADDLLREFPNLVQPELADWPDAALDGAVDHMSRRELGSLERNADTADRVHALVRRAALEDEPGFPVADGSAGHLTVLGLRAWLYGYRARQAAPHTAIDAARWAGAAALAPHVRADMSFDELGVLCREAVSLAAADGVKLLAPLPWLVDLRATRRREVRAELARTAEHIADLDAQLKPARVRRRALVASILAWNENDTDASLGRDAGLSHTAVKSIRDALNADDDGAE